MLKYSQIIFLFIPFFSNFVYAEKPKWYSDAEIACEFSASHYAPQAYDWKFELLRSMTITNEKSKERENIIELHKRKKEKYLTLII